MTLYPRMPKRPKRREHYTDCRARETQDGRDCTCLERDDAAWEDEGDRRYDAWKDDGGDRRGARGEE
jgi:hypothetical protein